MARDPLIIKIQVSVFRKYCYLIGHIHLPTNFMDKVVRSFIRYAKECKIPYIWTGGGHGSPGEVWRPRNATHNLEKLALEKI